MDIYFLLEVIKNFPLDSHAPRKPIKGHEVLSLKSIMFIMLMDGSTKIRNSYENLNGAGMICLMKVTQLYILT